MKKKTGIDLLKEKYGMDYTSYRYITPGGEMLKYIGEIVIYVHYKKDEQGQWQNEFKKAQIVSISDYDSLNMTYLCKYKTEDSEDIQEMRIIPEGFEWIEAADEKDIQENSRFIPYSIHCRLVEDETFYDRVKTLYETRDTMKIEELQDIAKSKEQDVILRYSHNIGIAVKLDDDRGYLWVRLHKISLYHKAGTQYSLRLTNDERTWIMMINSEDKEYYNKELCGDVKILDLADFPEETKTEENNG